MSTHKPQTLTPKQRDALVSLVARNYGLGNRLCAMQETLSKMVEELNEQCEIACRILGCEELNALLEERDNRVQVDGVEASLREEPQGAVVQ